MTKKKTQIITGIAASPGFAIGQVLLMKSRDLSFSHKKIAVERIPLEISVLRKALQSAAVEITRIKNSVLESVGKKEAQIFDTHLMMLKDLFVIDPVIEKIRKERKDARYAFHLHLTSLISKFEKQKSKQAQEKAFDLKDIYNRVMDSFVTAPQLMAQENVADDSAVIVSHILTPSSVTGFNQSNTKALLTDVGGRTSHVSILARALKIPAVAGLQNISEIVSPGEPIIVDGGAGLVIINPRSSDIRKYEAKIEHFEEIERDLYATHDLDPITIDGKFIRLCANIELPIEADEVLKSGANGVGLYRSEFLFFQKNLPGEKEQMEAYSYILNKLKGYPVAIRTLDAGGDKVIPHLSDNVEANPFMGWRSIRLCLDQKDLFMTQLRALLRVSTAGNLRLMLPMITSLREIRAVKTLLKEARQQLEKEKIPYRSKIDIGITVEVPAAVIMIKELAAELDFLSIGTNDLTQFTLAVDRSNEKIASLFDPHHPGVLRMIRSVIDAGHDEGIDVSVCGEMASDPMSALLLIGMGVDELSMSPWAIMEVKKLVRSISYLEASEIAKKVLSFSNIEEIGSFLHKNYARKINELGISSFITRQKALSAVQTTELAE